jgi:syntenin-1
MSLYPSLEDMKVDHMAQAQVAVAREQQGLPALSANPHSPLSGSLYSGLALSEFSDYGGLQIDAQALERYMPRDVAQQVSNYQQPLASITPVQNVNAARAEVKQGVRMVILAKDGKGKVGLAVDSIDKGVFVSFVYKDSAASMGGMRFGDQILQINGETLAGWNAKKVMKFIDKAGAAAITFAIRDRPYARALTVVKDGHNAIGFTYQKGEITAIVKESSAARNGLLIHHQLMEINGQNCVGIKDEDIQTIIRQADRSVTLTIIPTFIYKHLVSSIGSKRLRECMDHSIPEM